MKYVFPEAFQLSFQGGSFLFWPLLLLLAEAALTVVHCFLLEFFQNQAWFDQLFVARPVKLIRTHLTDIHKGLMVKKKKHVQERAERNDDDVWYFIRLHKCSEYSWLSLCTSFLQGHWQLMALGQTFVAMWSPPQRILTLTSLVHNLTHGQLCRSVCSNTELPWEFAPGFPTWLWKLKSWEDIYIAIMLQASCLEATLFRWMWMALSHRPASAFNPVHQCFLFALEIVVQSWFCSDLLIQN